MTGEGGGYHFSALPPGAYSVRFELEGMQPLDRRVTIGLAQDSRADADMRMTSLGEAMTVTT